MATCSVVDPFHNRLLASLPGPVKQRLLTRLEPCFLPVGRVLFEAGKPVHQIYFPVDAVVSLSYVTVGGGSTEVSIVGNEGFVGIAQFLGGRNSHTRDVVEIAGRAFRLTPQAAMDEFGQHAEFMVVILRYTQALMTQMAQTAVCNRHHRLEQQLCRLLLMTHDRLRTNDMSLTQEAIANMLGVRREGVTEAAGRLQKAGLISYARGRIKVENRPGLEQRSCECYTVVKKEYDRLLPNLEAV